MGGQTVGATGRGSTARHALVQSNGWIAAGDEAAVTNGVLVLLVAAIDRANTAVGLHDNSIVTGLFERREEHSQPEDAVAGDLGGADFLLVLAGAEIAAQHHTFIRGNLVDQCRV